jgi:hypothetical protein
MRNKLELKSLKRMSEDQQGSWQLLDRWGLRIRTSAWNGIWNGWNRHGMESSVLA